MKTALIVAATLAIAGPALAGQAAPAAAPAPATVGAQGVSGLADGMAVVSSDGVRVAEVRHLYRRTSYGPNDTFMTLAPLQVLRRIYGREAFVEDGQLRLRMTAAQFRARSQNPPDWINGNPPPR
ncbi:hypothetical protein [Brevundimonas sp. Root1423]|uniref:hypothetical protein n=1 Tax=Brevundimonas sp. Root1423 TaxID=1736462 RepID=UPI0006F4D3B2|nr:hypothetical protein [Brevundimonas sp. Root1423]KQY89685.1 hypothetical protein ASD25_03800 [Brevundimonas sp. Root1423]